MTIEPISPCTPGECRADCDGPGFAPAPARIDFGRSRRADAAYSPDCACAGSPCIAAPAVDGVYVTDLLRDPEPFGERIDEPLGGGNV